jgi:AAA+ ATPase superfamily predicted ATPase
VAFVYEDICRARYYEEPEIFPWKIYLPNIGRWWNKTTEIDVVGFDDESVSALFGECKYRNQPMGADVLYQLEEKAKQVPWRRDDRHNYYALFSISGFDEKLQEIAKNRKDVVLLD